MNFQTRTNRGGESASGAGASAPAAPLRLSGIVIGCVLISACGGSTTAVAPAPAPTSVPPATPPPTSYTLSVSTNGWGAVSSNPVGIHCGTTCGADFAANTPVQLIASAANGQEFAGWGGACSGGGTCTVNMTQARSITASFRQAGVVDPNCTGTWPGTEENRVITAWPYRDCFRTNPVGTRTRITNNVGAEVVWDVGAGWNGQNALRVRPPDGSLGRLQGYAGLGEHVFHSVRTKRLNIRYLIRYNANWAAHAQRNKWEVAIKHDYTDPNNPRRLQGCERGIAEGRRDPLNHARESFTMQQGVCTSPGAVPYRNDWHFGPGVRENEWISIENEFDLETGLYSTYITTQDGVYNQSLHTQINIAAGEYSGPVETVPSPYWWGSIDCTAGCFWDWPDDHGTVPRPVDTYIWYSHFVMSNSYIGPPAGFVQ